MAINDDITAEKPIPPFALEGILLQNTYKMEELIGEGGMAWVYRAHHRHLNAPVAVKVLRRERTKKPKHQERFLREAQIQYSLEHPNIVRVLEFVQDRGAVGFVQEWCDEGDLHVYLQSKQRVSLMEEIQHLFLPIVNAVHYAHEQGVIHRDLKPQNILLRRQGERLVPKVNDFGLAKQLGLDSLTHTGAVMGTFHYMPPEQFEETKHVDARADVYSLGVILYQLSTGRLPYDSAMPGLMLQVLRGSYAPPKEAPEALHPVISKCLMTKAEERFATAYELQEAIQSALGLPSYSWSSSDGLISFRSSPNNTPLPKKDGAQRGWLSNTAEVSPQASEGPSKKVASLDPNATMVSEELASPNEGLPSYSALPALDSNQQSGEQKEGRGFFSETLPAEQPAYPASNLRTVEGSRSRNLGVGVVILLFAVVGFFAIQPGFWKPSNRQHDAGVVVRKPTLVPEVRRKPSPAPDANVVAEKPKAQPQPRVALPLKPDNSNSNNGFSVESAIRKAQPPSPRSGGELLVTLKGLPNPSKAQKIRLLKQAKELIKQKHYVEAQLLLDNGCHKNNPTACYLLGFFYEQGFGGFKDVDRAKRIWNSACDWGSSHSCLAQARHSFADPNPRAAKQGMWYVNRACRLKNGKGCSWLGLLLQLRSKKLKGKSSARTLFLFRKACYLDDKLGCWLAGRIMTNPSHRLRNQRLGLKLLGKGCLLGSLASCKRVVHGWVRRSSFNKTTCPAVNNWIRKGCSLGGKALCSESCAGLARKYHAPPTVRKSEKDNNAETLFFRQLKPR